MVKKAELPRHVIKTAMDLAARYGWRNVGLGEIAEEAKVPLADLYRLYRTKGAILSALASEIDAEVLAAKFDHDEGDSARDRLFDVMMRRFEALQPYREGLRAVLCDAAFRPASTLCSGGRLLQSMTWMLEAAGIGSAGLRGRLRRKGLAGIYVGTMLVWLRDDSPDMAATMAALDKRLASAESIAGIIWGRRIRPTSDLAPAAG